MPAYNFKKEFASKVEDGTKPHTIRPCRKRPTVEGDTLYLYTGMRTKNCRKLREEKCIAVMQIDFEPAGDGVDVWLNRKWISRKDLHLIALKDGFDTVDSFMEFFKSNYGIPNKVPLELILWAPS